MQNQVVFRDDQLASSWISPGWSSKIARELAVRGFAEKNALELESWLMAQIAGDVHESVVVFSQDLVPRSLMQSSPNGLFRRYLDAGGRVVWIGDTPLWTQALPRPWENDPDGKSKDREEVYASGLHYAMLGVQPLIAEASSKIQWSPKLRGRMKSTWISLRPIALEVSRSWRRWRKWAERQVGDLEVQPLAKADATLLPCGWNVHLLARWKQSGFRITEGSLGLNLGGAGGGVTVAETFPRELSFMTRMSLASAWRVSFNQKYPAQGFYRLWDRGSEELEPPAVLLSDILQMATVADIGALPREVT